MLIFVDANQVGNEFSSVEALWSQFENFMGPPQDQDQNQCQDQDQEINTHGEGEEAEADEQNDMRAGAEEDGKDQTPMRERR
jgi:DASH complex subunit DAD1